MRPSNLTVRPGCWAMVRSCSLLSFAGSCRSDALEDHRDALAAADAGRRAAELLAAHLEFADQRQQQARAGGAERMAERDRAAVDVALVAVELELLLATEVLRRERLVDLDTIRDGVLEDGELARLVGGLAG